jgi:hypothetical protein
MSEIKNCPKCGGEMEVQRLRSYGGADVAISGPGFWGKLGELRLTRAKIVVSLSSTRK